MTELLWNYGIYVIAFNHSNKLYLGSTYKTFFNLYKNTLFALKYNQFHNKQIQQLFNENETNLVFSVLEVCNSEITKEQLQHHKELLEKQNFIVVSQLQKPIHKKNTKNLLNLYAIQNPINKKIFATRSNIPILKLLKGSTSRTQICKELQNDYNKNPDIQWEEIIVKESATEEDYYKVRQKLSTNDYIQPAKLPIIQMWKDIILF